MTAQVTTPNLEALRDSKPKLNQPLRSGTWTREEEEYVAALIEEFKKGHLCLKEGMSLRCFISKMVRCCPKRVSKKFEGSNYNGKQLYEQSEKEMDPEEANRIALKLRDFEMKFEESIRALAAAEESRKVGTESLVGPTGANARRGSNGGLLSHPSPYPNNSLAAGPGMLNVNMNMMNPHLALLRAAGAGGAPFGLPYSGLAAGSLASMHGVFNPAFLPAGLVDPTLSLCMQPSTMMGLAANGWGFPGYGSRLGSNLVQDQMLAQLAVSRAYERDIGLALLQNNASEALMGGIPLLSTGASSVDNLQGQQIGESHRKDGTRQRVMDLVSKQSVNSDEQAQLRRHSSVSVEDEPESGAKRRRIY